MLTGRFDNLSTEELRAREAEAREEHKTIEGALYARLRQDCPLVLGHVYRFLPDLVGQHGKPSWLRPRRFLLAYLTPARAEWQRGEEHYIAAQGFLDNKRSTTGDGYNRKVFVIGNWDEILDLGSGEPGPRNYKDE